MKIENKIVDEEEGVEREMWRIRSWKKKEDINDRR